MKKSLLFLGIFIAGMNNLADPSVIADIKELDKIGRDSMEKSISLQEYWTRQAEIESRVEPIVQRDITKLVGGELTPLLYDLLNNPETLDFFLGHLYVQFLTTPAETQTKVLEKVFDAAPSSKWGRIILSFLASCPKEAFAGKEIQQWLVDTINGGMPGGAFYFILTEESARVVTKTAVANMNKLSKGREHTDSNLFSLMSAVFLASHGDDDAVKLLDSLLDQRDIDSGFDTSYLISAAAMSWNEKLIKKILAIVTTDKRSRFFAHHYPEISFAHKAAAACALMIEGFPAVDYGKYDEITKEKVRGWIEDNPTYTIKPKDPRVFLYFHRIFPAMASVMEKK